MTKIQHRLLCRLLAEGELAGREWAKSYEMAYDKSISYGRLYVEAHHMKEMGWIDSRDVSDEFGKLRMFSLTESGKDKLLAPLRLP